MPHFPKPFYRKRRRRWYVEINGRQLNLGADETEAFQRYHALMAAPEPVERTSPAAPQLVAVLCDQFLCWVQTHRALPTYEGYRYRLQRFIDRHPSLEIGELRPFHVQEWVDSYDFSSNSRRNYMRSIKTCLRWCCRQGYIDKSPLEHLAMPAQERRDVYVPPDEFSRMLEYVPDANLRDLLITTYEIGCRPQESLRVERRHVDVERQRWIFPISEAKGKTAPRIVYLTEKALKLTQRLMLQHATGPLFRNSRDKPWTADAVNCAMDRVRLRMGKAELDRRGESIPDDAIERLAKTLNQFRRTKGRKVRRPNWHLLSHARRLLQARRTKELVPRYSLYALRHSWATNALQRGLDALTVAILMGHRDPSTLAKVYQHLAHNPEHLLQQARRAAV